MIDPAGRGEAQKLTDPTILSRRRMYPIAGIVSVLLYLVVALLLRNSPLALAFFGNIALVGPAALVAAIVWRRRGEWAGCQRLFWNTFAIGMVLWIIGHIGWVYHDVVLQDRSGLQWHTLFSLCGGIAPFVALFARPHRGARRMRVASHAVDLAAYGLLAVFLYAYFVLVPSLMPAARGDAQATLLYAVQVNRLLFLIGLVAAAWAARGTDWRTTYLRLGAGVAIGFAFRIGANAAIARGDYEVGSVYDLAWIIPWLSYAWAAAEAPASPPAEQAIELHPAQPSIVLSAIPVLLIPVIGYGLPYIEYADTPIDSFRALLTGVTTVCGLGLLTLRLAAQSGELVRADARLRLLAAATEQTADLILITHADGRFEHANEAFQRALGYTRRELVLLRFGDLIQRGASAGAAHIPAEVARHGIWRGTLVRRRRDGSTFPAACTVVGLRDVTGVITHFVGVERDVTDELRLRDQLVHSERLSAIGELVAGVAHEINNPLQTIVGCVELMLDDRPGAMNRRDLEIVRREAARAGQIVRNLLSFVHRGAPDRTVADLNQIVRATVELREYHLTQQNIRIETRYAPAPLPVLVSRDDIQQIVLNLLLNAEHAIASSSSSGTIMVATTSADGMQILDISDTGPGVRSDLRGRIFEPFFTTKSVGEGTGLGLPNSHGIAVAHGGSLCLRDSPAGACFRLTLPADGVAQHEPVVVDLQRARHALVVDDEEAIRRLMIRLLERRGFEVLEADTATAALALAGGREMGLIVCDVRMPGLSGFDFYRRLALEDPTVSGRFIFITGGSTSAEHRPPDLAHVAVLAKPFTAADLDALLARMGLTLQSR